MRTLHAAALSTSTGVLLALGWPAIGGMPFFLFAAFVPLLLVEDDYSRRRKSGERVKGLFLLAWLAFAVWNALTTWWIYCITGSFVTKIVSAGFAILLNGLFMAVVFMLFHFTKRHTGPQRGYLAFAAYWIGFEYLHYNWDLSYPWLTLGNGLSDAVPFVQWYEYTGVSGGSLWILLVNLIVFFLVRKVAVFKAAWRRCTLPASLLVAAVIVPAAISYRMYVGYAEKDDPVDIVIVQPNIDPYNEKFSGKSPEEQVAAMLKLAAEQTDNAVDYIVGPETSLPSAVNVDRVHEDPAGRMIAQFTERYPGAKFITGLSSYRVYEGEDRPTPTARRFEDEAGWFDYCNSAMQVDSSGRIQLYHKSKLVLGVEMLPFPSLFSPIQEAIWDLGGTTGSLATQDERSVFVAPDGGRRIAPVICWESVYGDFMTGYVRNGAELIFIVTNDGWWGDSPGYRQHKSYARLRAIELRRSIARSANTGLSCFISQRGDVLQQTEWWQPAAIRGTLNANSNLTFFARNGDVIGRILAWLAVFMLAYAVVRRVKK